MDPLAAMFSLVIASFRDTVDPKEAVLPAARPARTRPLSSSSPLQCHCPRSQPAAKSNSPHYPTFPSLACRHQNLSSPLCQQSSIVLSTLLVAIAFISVGPGAHTKGVTMSTILERRRLGQKSSAGEVLHAADFRSPLAQVRSMANALVRSLLSSRSRPFCSPALNLADRCSLIKIQKRARPHRAGQLHNRAPKRSQH